MKKRVVALSIIGLVLAIFMINAVAAQSFIADLFTEWSAGAVDTNIAKYMFFILITLIIYSILEVIGFFPQGYIRWPIALIVAFLSTAFIAPEEVLAMLTSYTALGLLIGSFLPLVFLVLFTYAVTKRGGGGGLVLQYVFWLAFVIFMLYKSISVSVVVGANAAQILIWGNWIITLAAVIIGLVFNKQLRKWFRIATTEAERARAQRGASRITMGAETLSSVAGASEGAGGPSGGRETS